MDNKSPKCVYVYSRFSSKKQADGSSIDRQERAQNDWLALNPEYEVIRLTADAGKSGFKGEHLDPENGHLGKFLQQLESGFIETPALLLVESFSRFSRLDYTQATKLMERLWNRDVTLVIANGNTWFSPSDRNELGKIMRLVVEIDIAHKESLTRSERIRGAIEKQKKRAREQSETPNVRRPFWISKNGKLNKYNKVVEDIFTMYLDGLGVISIRNILREKYGDIDPLKKISATTMLRIITNRVCIGELWGCKVYPEVVPKEVFFRAQEILENKSFKNLSKNKTFPLQGLFTCGYCGSGMTIQSSGRKLPFIRCSKRQRIGNSQDGCPSNMTFPYVVAHRFFHFYVEPITLQAISDTTRQTDIKLELMIISKELRTVGENILEQKSVISERQKQGKSVSILLNLLQDSSDYESELKEKFRKNEQKLSSFRYANISEDTIKLRDDKNEYALKLHLLGVRMIIKDRNITFTHPSTGEIIALLSLEHFNRSTKEYLYKFDGSIQHYKRRGELNETDKASTMQECIVLPSEQNINAEVDTISFNGRILTSHISCDDLTNFSRGEPKDSQSMAMIFDEIEQYSEAGPMINISAKRN